MSKQKPITNKNNPYWLPPTIYRLVIEYARTYTYYKQEASSLLGISGINYDGMPHGTDVGNPTEAKGIRYTELNDRCKYMEALCDCCLPNASRWLLKAVTEGKSYDQLIAIGMECSRRQFYKARQKFYYCIAKKINIL